ncbi:hypothetical protein Q8A67_023419 [Cirrhinus molitorella]|uniref:Uncharacterized protein n=1 Tax=Cirrhinus molitorella TaxID=172907 RepID=A0AA88TCK0_9TELE|nr:hypothetical protein Q8A67_023419 [Cirrhinus molitorella]
MALYVVRLWGKQKGAVQPQLITLGCVPIRYEGRVAVNYFSSVKRRCPEEDFYSSSGSGKLPHRQLARRYVTPAELMELIYGLKATTGDRRHKPLKTTDTRSHVNLKLLIREEHVGLRVRYQRAHDTRVSVPPGVRGSLEAGSNWLLCECVRGGVSQTLRGESVSTARSLKPLSRERTYSERWTWRLTEWETINRSSSSDWSSGTHRDERGSEHTLAALGVKGCDRGTGTEQVKERKTTAGLSINNKRVSLWPAVSTVCPASSTSSSPESDGNTPAALYRLTASSEQLHTCQAAEFAHSPPFPIIIEQRQLSTTITSHTQTP